MTMMPFHLVFPQVARSECRAVTPLGSASLPERGFLFVELFCVAPRCDCRRVMLHVIEVDGLRRVASINHAFEPPEPPYEDEGQTFLDPINPQSEISDALLDLFQDVLAQDADYGARLERHYAMFKRVVDDPAHPDHGKVRNKLHDDPDFRSAFPQRRSVSPGGPKVGPNEKCPCGSGKKYKKCCRS